LGSGLGIDDDQDGVGVTHGPNGLLGDLFVDAPGSLHEPAGVHEAE